MAIDILTFPQRDDLTLAQAASLRGFARQIDLARAVGVAQATVSAMYRGSREYPKVRRALAVALLPGLAEPEADRLILRFIDNGRPPVAGPSPETT